MSAAAQRLKFVVIGRVQGVGFRYFVCSNAHSLGLVGWVRNLPDGKVEGEIQGTASALAMMRESLRVGPSWARVEDLVIEEVSLPGSCEDRMEVR